MKLIVGLGNPGEKYQNTRHNLGFMVVDELARKRLRASQTQWKMEAKANALILQVDPETILVKPQTFMNASGFSVHSIFQSYDLSICDIWVIHDEVDLPLGKMKIRVGGGTAGHHGVESVIKQLGTDQFLRFRLGIGRPIKGEMPGLRSKSSVEDYVLREFDKGEKGKAKEVIKRTVRAIGVALEKGIEKAMNQFNN